MERTITFLNKRSGRDKVAKFFHYTARIGVWHMRNKKNEDRAVNIEKFRQMIGDSRRVQRFFSWIGSFPSIWNTVLHKKPTTPFSFLFFIADIADVLYYLSDNLTLMHRFGFIKLSPKTEDFLDNIVGSWTWMVSIAIWILHDIHQIWKISTRKKSLQLEYEREGKSNIEQELEIKSVNAELKDTLLGFISNLADLQLAIFFCFPNSWPSHWVGVFGTLNSLTSGYQIWKS